MENLTVIVPFWNGQKTIERLLDSLPAGLPVIVVDDRSDAPYQSKRSGVEVIRPTEKGYFSGAVNAGIGACKTDVLVLNQDAWLEGEEALGLLGRERERYALIGEGIAGRHPAWPKGYVQGTFMFLRRDALEAVGLLNAKDYPLWGSTCEWQLRACRQGFRTLVLKEVPGFRHREGRRPHGAAITAMLQTRPRDKQWFIRTPPMVSVVVPCFNYGQYLADAVNSLIGGPTCLGEMPGQTFQSFEVIIVDDGSTDDSGRVADELADEWKGIQAVHRKNGGTAVALNTGIARAVGQFIAILSADDMMAPERLERMVRAQQQHPHGVVCDGMKLFSRQGILRDGRGRERLWRMPDYDFERLLLRNIMHSGIMFPRRAWEEVGGYPEAMADGREDWAMNVNLGIAGYCGVRVDYPGYLYRRDGQNRTLRNTTPDHYRRFAEKMEALFPAIYAGVRQMACCGQKEKQGTSGARSANGVNGMVPGEEGMTLLTYTGLNAGTVSYWGKVTGTRYLFGGRRKLGWVDSRDIPGFLGIYEGSYQAFAVVYEEPEGQADGSPVTEQSQAEEPLAVTDPNDLTVTELKDLVATGLSAEQLSQMLALEQAGKNRSTAVKVLEDALAVLEVPA